jgi:hypothetical protein
MSTAKAQASDETDTGLKSAKKELLYSALANLRGHIDFGAVVNDIGVVNAEAVFVLLYSPFAHFFYV